ncbi:hypothetical protein M747DRAFT_41379 [Aspergillus niger ATCC 13496]|nr:hypothetical protein M747DRAFT_41379 [Aspergillus niger ATCC 13496]
MSRPGEELVAAPPYSRYTESMVIYIIVWCHHRYMTAPPGRPAPKTLLDRPVNESPKLTAGRITGNAGVTPGLAPCCKSPILRTQRL